MNLVKNASLNAQQYSIWIYHDTHVFNFTDLLKKKHYNVLRLSIPICPFPLLLLISSVVNYFFPLKLLRGRPSIIVDAFLCNCLNAYGGFFNFELFANFNCCKLDRNVLIARGLLSQAWHPRFSMKWWGFHLI